MKRGFLFNKALRILLITNSLVLFAGAMLDPIYALFVQKVGGDLLDASLTGSFFAIAAGITTLIAGKLTDRNKRDELILAFGYAVMGLGFFLLIFVNSIYFLFFVQVLIGFAEAFYSPALDALYTKHVTKTKAGREWGAYEAMDYFSTALGAVVGGVVVTLLGFRVMFAIMFALSMISAYYIYRLHRGIL